MTENNDTVFYVENDDDIKIADSSGKKHGKPADDNRLTVAMLRELNRDGELDNARKAGSDIADEILNIRFLRKDGSSVEDNITAQSRCLMAFGVVSGCGRYIKSDIVERIVINKFYDAVRAADENFYMQASDLAAMSSYYLDARRGENLDQKIGFSFASLCHDSENHQLIRLGNEIFRRCCVLVKNTCIAHDLEMSED